MRGISKPFTLKLHVAGVRIEATSTDFPFSSDSGPWYSRFMTAPSSVGSEEVVVKLEVLLEKPPDCSGLEKIFDAGAWSLYREGDAHWIVLAAHPTTGTPAWAARLTADFQSGRVYCDPALTHRGGIARGLVNPILHRLDQVIMMRVLSELGGCIIHATGAALGACGVAFAGKSGAGKSTLARFLQNSPLVSRGLRLLSDDRVIIREIRNDLMIFGTPWPGDAQIAAAEEAPLRAIVFLKHGREDKFARMTARDAALALLPVMSVPWYDREHVARFMAWCHHVVERIPVWEFSFRPHFNVWKSVKRFFQELGK